MEQGQMCKLVWRGERETVKWGLAGETGMQWLPLITEELSGGRWMESIWPQGVEPGLVQQIGGRWIGAQYLRRQTCSKKLRAASGEREFSSAPKQLEQRAGWVILTANMYGNAYRGGWALAHIASFRVHPVREALFLCPFHSWENGVSGRKTLWLWALRS